MFCVPTGVRKLETSILRLYVVNTIQTNKNDKLTEFFEKMAADLQSQTEWREWFSKSCGLRVFVWNNQVMKTKNDNRKLEVNCGLQIGSVSRNLEEL